MGNKTFFMADLHLGHKNALKFDGRPFETIEEQDDKIIKRWNRVVTNNDTVYILGDFTWYKDYNKNRSLVEALKGNKILIRGNHDKTYDIPLFKQEYSYREIKADDGRTIILCHYPILAYNHEHHGAVHLYGHVHASWEYEMVKQAEQMKQQKAPNHLKMGPMYNVGCMMPWIDYQPRTLKEIEAYIIENATASKT